MICGYEREIISTFELKWPTSSQTTNNDSMVGIDYYNESTDWVVIIDVIDRVAGVKINSSVEPSVEPWLEKNGLIPFANILTNRTRYEIKIQSSNSNQIDSNNDHIFRVDLDKVQYLKMNGEIDETKPNYEIGEVELDKPGGNMTSSAALLDIFNQIGIQTETVKGKVLEYLSKYSTKHYQELENSGLLASKLGLKLSSSQILFKNIAVNYHFTRKCNYSCKFCFHTAKTNEILTLNEMKHIIKEIKNSGAKKINFAGGEPFLPSYHEILGEIVKYSKEIGFASVSIISNNSHINENWFKKYGKYLDILGISCDTADQMINHQHGRFPAGNKIIIDSKEINHPLNKLKNTANLCKKYNILFKINTVITIYNMNEDLSQLINELNPIRWKVFQVLPLEGENYGKNAGKKQDVLSLITTNEHFDNYVKRNINGLIKKSILKAENNETMKSSYILIDEYGRLLDSSTGGKKPTESILKVGIDVAAEQLLKSLGGGFDRIQFEKRGGFFPEEWSAKK